MYPAVKSVTPTEDYVLSIDFDNGEQGLLDMKPYLDFGVFRQLREQHAFSRVRVSRVPASLATSGARRKH